MESDLTKPWAETRKMEEEKVEALHSFTDSINQSVKMLDREKQKLEAEKARTDDLTLHLTTEKAKNEDLTLHLTETQQKLDTEKAKNKIEANLDAPSTSITVISHSGASIKYPELMGQYNLVDYINIWRKPVYRKGPNWIFYGSKSLVEL